MFIINKCNFFRNGGLTNILLLKIPFDILLQRRETVKINL